MIEIKSRYDNHLVLYRDTNPYATVSSAFLGAISTRIRDRLKGARLDGLNLTNKNLSGLDLSEICATKATFINCSFRDTILTGSALSDSSFIGCDLSFCKMRNSMLNGVRFEEIYSDGVDFGYSNLQGAVFKWSSIKNSTFNGCYLQKARFGGTSLYGSKFEKATMSAAMAAGSNNFTNCCFFKALLNGSDFRGADLTGASFYGANLTDAKFDRGALSRALTKNTIGLETSAGISAISKDWPELAKELIKYYKVGRTFGTSHDQLLADIELTMKNEGIGPVRGNE